MVGERPLELPMVREAPPCARFLYDRTNFYIGKSKSDLREKLLWLEEVVQEAKKSFSKPEEVSLLPKTPSMKNKRKAKTRSRNLSNEEKEANVGESSDDVSPTELGTNKAKRSKLSFVPEDDAGEVYEEKTDENQAPVILSAESSSSTENLSKSKKNVKGKKKNVKTQIQFDVDSSPERELPVSSVPLETAAETDDDPLEPVDAAKAPSPLRSLANPSAIDLPSEEGVTPQSPPPQDMSNTQPQASAVKEKIQIFQQMASGESSSEENSSSKPSEAKHETRRLTSAMGAAFASPQHVNVPVIPAVGTAAGTPTKPQSILNLLDEAGRVDDAEKAPPPLVDDDDVEDDDVEDDDALVKAAKEEVDLAKSAQASDTVDNVAEEVEDEEEVKVSETKENNEVDDVTDDSRRKSGRMSFRSRQSFAAKKTRQSASSRASVSAARRRSSTVRSVRRSSVKLSRSARDEKASNTAKWIKHMANLSDDEIRGQVLVKVDKNSASATVTKTVEDEKEDDVASVDKNVQNDGDKDVDFDGDIAEAVDDNEESHGNDNEEEEEEEKQESPPVRMTRTKARKRAEEEEEEEEGDDEEERDVVETPPQRCTRSKMRKPSEKDKPGHIEVPGVRAEMITPSATSPVRSRVTKPLVTPVHSANASKTIRKIQEKLLSSSKSVTSSRTINLTSSTPSMSRIPSHSKMTTPSSASKFSSVTLTGTKFASGVASFINKKTTPNKTISPADEMRLREARLKEKEQKEAERKQRLKDKQEAELEEKRKRNKERQEKAEQLRLDREKIEAANRMKTAKTKNALLTLADKKKAEKDKEERERKKEQLRKAEMAEIKRSEEEAKRLAKQQLMIDEEKRKEDEKRKILEEQEKERLRKLDEQRRQEELQRSEKQRAERQEQERIRRLAEEKEKERQRHLEQRKKELEKERIERQKEEMNKLRQKEMEKTAAAAQRKAEEEALKPKTDERIPVPNLNSTYDVKYAASTASSLNSTYNAAAKTLNSTVTVAGKPADATFEVSEHDASSYDMTPKRLPTPSTNDNYVIDDLASDDETDDEDNPRKKIPQWAEKQQLRPALVRQTYKPPNLAVVFGVIEAPDLTNIFTNVVKKKYIRRGSSGVWDCPILPPGDYSEKS